ncbi:hypothetical protein [Agromyces bracchium]|uniref:DUF4148 domain-containing protein n=1 Tax=Agromyces bracchium TaxID=88376 RepID=A0A6I3LZI7_9MICO|nr:hypothetical protein [Agromyces bracchium]MTH66779.1 hypothetical protein [Agromyces bracchium]
MNTTQNIQRIIATGVLAASAGLACSACAGQSTAAVAERISDAQTAEQRGGYRDLAERRSELARERGPAGAELYRDQAERRLDVGAPVTGDVYRDLAERRLDVDVPVSGDVYRDLAERRPGAAGH